MTTRASSLALAVCFVASCSTDPAPPGNTGDGGLQGGLLDASVGPIDAAPTPGPGADASPCTSPQLAAGDHDFSISAGGLTRTYHVHVPPGLDASGRAPLLLNLHPLVLNGPPTVTGFAAGRAKVEEIIAYWPALMPKSEVQPEISVIEA